MERYRPIVSGCVTATLVTCLCLTSGCARRSPPQARRNPPDSIRRFLIQQFSEHSRMTLTGEAAEVSPERDRGTVRNPSLSLHTQDGTVEITSGPEGIAEILMDPKTGTLKDFRLTGRVRVVQKPRDPAATGLEATCEKMTYRDRDRLLVLEGNPVLNRPQEQYAADTIHYFWEENRLELKGNVRIEIRPNTNPAR